ncbi:MAG TPA: hypothetical protein VH700_13980 [Gemmatimonadales bacterium]|jgi:hypothetical protein
MATTPNDPHTKAMEREVNRLLAQLAHSGAETIAEPRLNGSATPPPIARARSSGPTRSVAAGPRGSVAALWGRGVLAVALGAAMIVWPYPHPCGWALLGYLGAVAAVLLAAAWIAFASWRMRNGVAHVLSLVLFYWGLVLAAEQVLPRIGYAADHGAWSCGQR